MTIFYNTSLKAAQKIDNFVDKVIFLTSTNEVEGFDARFARVLGLSNEDIKEAITIATNILGKPLKSAATLDHRDGKASIELHNNIYAEHKHTHYCTNKNCCLHEPKLSELPPEPKTRLTETAQDRIDMLRFLAKQFDCVLSDDYLNGYEERSYQGIVRSWKYLTLTPPVVGLGREESTLLEGKLLQLSDLLERHKQLLSSKIRQDMYNCQNEAQALLQGKVSPSGKHWAVTECGKKVYGRNVLILKNNKTGKARFRNIYSCGGVWVCPVCAKRIAERRREEIEQGLNIHYSQHGKNSTCMVTLTFPHSIYNSLKELKEAFTAALKRLREQRAYKKLCKDFAYRGLIRVLEITHGDNGWHPHLHEVWLLKEGCEPIDIHNLESAIFPLWQDACIKVGLNPPSREHGVNVRQAYSPAEYLVKFDHHTKWGTASELAKANTKMSLKKSSTPFDLLRRSARGDDHAGELFVEYANEFFGKRQVFWSKGLKEQLGLMDLDDEEILEQNEEDEAEVIYKIPAEAWHELLSTQNGKASDVRALLLDIAEVSGAQGLDLYIKNLKLRSFSLLDTDDHLCSRAHRKRK